MRSPYEVLRVDRSASEGELRRAYRQRLKEAHPDHGGSRGEFRAVRAAYEALTDGRGDGVRHDEDPDSAAAPDVEPSTAPDVRVEYLNYEVLADHGLSLDDEALFERAAAAGLDPEDHGVFAARPDEPLLDAAEAGGFAWPYACRGGACANCAVAVLSGELAMPVNHILPAGWLDRRIRLSCVGTPATDELAVVFNVKHLPGLDELRLPADRFDLAQRGD